MTIRNNKRIELQSNEPTQNAVNETVDAWTTYTRWWAAIKPTGGDESMRGIVSEGTVAYDFTIRYNPSVTAAHRILYDGRIFTISAVLCHSEDRVWQTIKAHEVVS